MIKTKNPTVAYMVFGGFDHVVRRGKTFFAHYSEGKKYFAPTALLIILSLALLCCTSPKTQPSPVLSPITTNTDSIFEYFENVADTAPARYVNNPDSFLNNLQLHPKTAEQQEMYAYGLIFMAYALKEHGDIYQSVRYYERVLGFIQQHVMKDPAYLDYVIKPLANNYIRIDDNRK